MATIGFETVNGSKYFIHICDNGNKSDTIRLGGTLHVRNAFIAEDVEAIKGYASNGTVIPRQKLAELELRGKIKKTSLSTEKEISDAKGRRIFMVLDDGRQALTSPYRNPIVS